MTYQNIWCNTSKQHYIIAIYYCLRYLLRKQAIGWGYVKAADVKLKSQCKKKFYKFTSQCCLHSFTSWVIAVYLLTWWKDSDNNIKHMFGETKCNWRWMALRFGSWHHRVPFYIQSLMQGQEKFRIHEQKSWGCYLSDTRNLCIIFISSWKKNIERNENMIWLSQKGEYTVTYMPNPEILYVWILPNPGIPNVWNLPWMTENLVVT